MFYQLIEVQYIVSWINKVHWGNQKENNETDFCFPPVYLCFIKNKRLNLNYNEVPIMYLEQNWGASVKNSDADSVLHCPS